MAKLRTSCKFTKGVSGRFVVINDIIEYNLPYMESDFTRNPGLMKLITNEMIRFHPKK